MNIPRLQVWIMMAIWTVTMISCGQNLIYESFSNEVQLSVILNDEVDASNIEQEFDEYNLVNLGQISYTRNRYRFAYEGNDEHAKKVIKLLQQSEYVKDVNVLILTGENASSRHRSISNHKEIKTTKPLTTK